MTFKRCALVLALGAWAAAGCKSSSSAGSSSGGGDPSLQDLAVAGDAASAMIPYFDGGTHLYDVLLSSSMTTASVTATPTDAAVRSVSVAQLGVGAATVPSGTAAPLAVPDPGGTSTVRVVSTTPDGTLSTGYTLRLTRRTALGTDGTLQSLTDNLSYLHFVPGTTTYAYDVLENEAQGYTITPTLADPLAALTIDGEPAQSGRPFVPNLTAGTNTFTLVVTSEDDLTQTTYTVTITMVPIVAVTGISLSCPPSVGSGDTLVPTITPPNATDTSVAWTSSDPTIATLDGAGHVIVARPTKQLDPPITITATSHDGGFQASCDVHVLWFTDDFEDLAVGSPTSIRKWNLLPVAGPNGTFSIASDGSNVLRYAAGGTGGLLATLQDAAWPTAITGDYYVEARIKPQTNGTTGNKQLYVVLRYQDGTHFYGAGLNMQSSTSSTRVEFSNAGASAPTGWRFARPLVMDTTWYTVRFELVGTTLTAYLDGELLGSITDSTYAGGKIGLYTTNKSFEIDDIKVGAPADKPVLLGISPSTSYAADVGDAPRVITVNAQKPNYTTGTYDPDTFTAVSSDPGVVSVAVSGTSVTLTPVAAGAATITFTSGSQPSLTKTITATISSFVMPTATYTLTSVVTPVAGSAGINADARLSITFDTAPTLGTGSVRIFRKSDDALVDVIKPTGETDSLGHAGQSAVRTLNMSLLKVSGNTLTIIPHHNRLAYGTEYYVAIANGLVTGTSLALNGTAFVGIGRAGNWSFTTSAAPATNLTSLTVDDDGTADFRTVQGALDYFMQNATVDTPVTVNVKNGTYDELLYLRGKNNVTIVGESRDGAVIQGRNAELLNGGSGASQGPGSGTPAGGRSVFLVETSDLLTFDTVTLKNTYPRASSGAQAEVIYFNNDTGRLVAKHAAFLSEQDTLQLKGYSWFYQSLVAGNVDFIWGANRVSLFEESEIRTIGDTANPTTGCSTSGCYQVQARTVTAADKGFVFLNSTLTHGPGPGPTSPDVPTGAGANSFLARAQAGSWFDNIVYVNCRMDNHIAAAGWYTTPPPNTTPTQTEGWREFGSMDLAGTALDVSGRATGIQLASSTGYSNRTEILQGYNSGAGWVPTP